MNQWIRRTVSGLSVASTLALLPAGIALAQQAPTAAPGEAPRHEKDHHHGRLPENRLLDEALRLQSLTPEQKTAIEELAKARRAAATPVREANAQVLLALARQVEQASIDAQALAPSLGAEESAAVAASAVERDTLARLHALLAPAQRSQLVDRLQADRHSSRPTAAGSDPERHGRRDWDGKLGLSPEQKTQLAANLRETFRAGDADARRAHVANGLESFRGDAFDASAFVHVERRGEREEKFAKAIVPILSPAQRAMLAGRLRAHAARESS